MELFETYDIDGIFLDGTLRWQNSPDYSAYEGLVQYTQEIRKRYSRKDDYGRRWIWILPYGLFDLFHTLCWTLGVGELYVKVQFDNSTTWPILLKMEVPEFMKLVGPGDSYTIKNAKPEFTIPSISIFNGDLENMESRSRTN